MQFKDGVTPTQQRGAQLTRPPLLQVYIAQLVLLIVVFIVIFTKDVTLAISVAAGGLISIAPNVYFARWVFRYSGAGSASNVARSFYRGEAGKFIITAALFALTFSQLRPVNEVGVFVAYIFMMVLNWVLALRFFKR